MMSFYSYHIRPSGYRHIDLLCHDIRNNHHNDAPSSIMCQSTSTLVEPKLRTTETIIMNDKKLWWGARGRCNCVDTILMSIRNESALRVPLRGFEIIDMGIFFSSDDKYHILDEA
jgi:hypothetical protein